MAFSFIHGMKIFFLALALVVCMHGDVQGTMITCEHLDSNMCAFAVSASRTRCLLEKHVLGRGRQELHCRTSDIEAGKFSNYVETNECINACGLDRNTIGISSDSLLEETHFTQKLCSPQCYNDCPNIVDLYFNLAAGEGLFLPKVCAGIIGSSVAAAPVAAAPESGSEEVACGPTQSEEAAIALSPALL